jgi:hypothetical protein
MLSSAGVPAEYTATASRGYPKKIFSKNISRSRFLQGFCKEDMRIIRFRNREQRTGQQKQTKIYQ